MAGNIEKQTTTTPVVSNLGNGTHVSAVVVLDKDGNVASLGGGGGGGSSLGSTGSGAVDASTQRVTLATDDGAVAAVQSLDSKTPSLQSGNVPTVQKIEQTDGTLANVKATENGAVAVGNGMKKFRDGFASLSQGTGPDAAIWTEGWSNQGTSFRGRRGNAAGSSYMLISMCPFTRGSEYVMETVRTFKYPMRFMIGHSMSQRILGQECEISIVSADGGGVEALTSIADMAISGTISVTSNVATINFSAPHPYRGADRIILRDNVDPRINIGPVQVTVVTPTQITVPLSITNGTYTAGGFVEWVDPFRYAKNATGIVMDQTTTTTTNFATRRNGFNTRLVATTIASSTATQSSGSPYSDAFNAAARHEMTVNQEEVVLVSRTQDSLSGVSGNARWSQGIPDEEKEYRIRVRVKNLNNLSRPVAKITSISKSGATMATVTTDVAHGLTTADFVQIYGVRDITNFPNLTTQTQVSSIVSATQFTIVIGSAVTATSAGGGVWKIEASNPSPGIFSQVAQSISRTGNVLTVVGNTTWATPLPGEWVHIYGCDATTMGLYDGAYRVLRVNASSLELESVGADFGSINCGGAVVRRTDVRIHFVCELEYTRHLVEISNSPGLGDAVKAIPVLPVSGTISTVSAVTSAALSIPTIVADTTSAAITSTTTGASITPTAGIAYNVNIPVTAVSGTTPTMDFSVEESDDSGTNWFKVYDFPRITTTGMYRSPILRMRGNRVRYVQTLGGTTPSFTRAINRMQISGHASQVCQIVDRTIAPNTLNSNSPALLVEGCQDFNLTVRVTAQTGAATIALQFSDDGSNWFTSASTVTTAVGVVQVKATNEQWRFVRATVSTAGTGVTLDYLQIKGVGR